MDQVDKWARKQGGDIGFFPFLSRSATCKPLAVALPVGATVTGFRLFAGDGDRGFHQCLQDGNGRWVCNVEHTNGQVRAVPNGVAFCGWGSVPSPRRITAANQVVGAVFKNWSRDRDRRASLTVAYRPASAKAAVAVCARRGMPNSMPRLTTVESRWITGAEAQALRNVARSDPERFCITPLD
jgi:hypothetical protein